MTTNTITSTPVTPPLVQRVRYARLWWVGLLAIVLAVVANLIVRAVSLQFITVSPEFLPLSMPAPTVVFTAVGVLAATTVFAIIGGMTRQPARTFTVVAFIALIISIIPNILMILNPASSPVPGSTTAGAIVLIIEHVVAAVVAVWTLTTLGVETLPASE